MTTEKPLQLDSINKPSYYRGSHLLTIEAYITQKIDDVTDYDIETLLINKPSVFSDSHRLDNEITETMYKSYTAMLSELNILPTYDIYLEFECSYRKSMANNKTLINIIIQKCFSPVHLFAHYMSEETKKSIKEALEKKFLKSLNILYGNTKLIDKYATIQYYDTVL